MIRAVIIAAILVIASFFLVINGASGEYSVEYAHHTVKAGQTVWEIASDYMGEQDKTNDVRELVWDIARTNNIQQKYIHAGDVLTIPLYKKVNKNH